MPDMSIWLDLWQTQTIFDLYHSYLLPSATILAQRLENVDILANMEDAWNNFIQSGQVWALLIGVFFGYVFRSFTSY
jgi:hypothetical protein